MDQWINVHALWQILVAGLICGAGLPAAFAIGLRALPAAAKAAPTTAAPTTAVPTTAAPTDAAPVIAGLDSAVPVQAAPDIAGLDNAVPVQAAPIQAAPVQAAPIQPTPVQAAPVQPAFVPVAGGRLVARNAVGIAVSVVCFALTLAAIAWGIYFIVAGG